MLTNKQKRFCQEYLVDMNATQAAMRAGYSKKAARKLGPENLNKPEIKEYIDSMMAKIESDRIATAKEVQEMWSSVMRGEQKETVMKYVEQGVQEEVEIPVGMSSRLKASELLAKAHGMFTEKVEQNIDLDLNIKVDYGD